jgi:hypothetical protein
MKLFNIQFSKISIFHLKKNPLRMKSCCELFLGIIHWNFTSTDLKNGFGGADSPASKRFIGGESH